MVRLISKNHCFEPQLSQLWCSFFSAFVSYLKTLFHLLFFIRLKFNCACHWASLLHQACLALIPNCVHKGFFLNWGLKLLLSTSERIKAWRWANQKPLFPHNFKNPNLNFQDSFVEFHASSFIFQASCFNFNSISSCLHFDSNICNSDLTERYESSFMDNLEWNVPNGDYSRLIHLIIVCDRSRALKRNFDSPSCSSFILYFYLICKPPGQTVQIVIWI